jgi:hypothetical protein
MSDKETPPTFHWLLAELGVQTTDIFDVRGASSLVYSIIKRDGVILEQRHEIIAGELYPLFPGSLSIEKCESIMSRLLDSNWSMTDVAKFVDVPQSAVRRFLTKNILGKMPPV